MAVDAQSSIGGQITMMRWNKDDLNKENKRGKKKVVDIHVDQRFKIEGQ